MPTSDKAWQRVSRRSDEDVDIPSESGAFGPLQGSRQSKNGAASGRNKRLPSQKKVIESSDACLAGAMGGLSHFITRLITNGKLEYL